MLPQPVRGGIGIVNIDWPLVLLFMAVYWLGWYMGYKA